MRFELRLACEAAEGARFQVLVRLPASVFSGEAEIQGGGGAVRFQFPDSAQPPEWCLVIVRASLRTLFRERAARGGYPARITRWRPEPRAAGDETS